MPQIPTVYLSYVLLQSEIVVAVLTTTNISLKKVAALEGKHNTVGLNVVTLP